MIDILRMPMERKRFYAIHDCIELRRHAEESFDCKIGFGAADTYQLEEEDRQDCYHILKYNAFRLTGHARLRPIPDRHYDCSIGEQIDDLSKLMDRRPAFEIQRVSIDASHHLSSNTCAIYEKNIEILREIITVAFRICNATYAKYLFCSSDKNGIKYLRDIGIKFSTLTKPIERKEQEYVILCIAVTNSNFAALGPLRVVGGTQHAEKMESGAPTRSIFDKQEALEQMKLGDDQTQH